MDTKWFSDDDVPPEVVQLNSFCLLSKWGFSDGDLLSWLYRFGHPNHHAVLVELVRKKLIPALDQEVEIQIIETIHNPCRAKTVDGVDVTRWHYESDCPVKLSPAWVIVSGAEVLAVAEALMRERR